MMKKVCIYFSKYSIIFRQSRSACLGPLSYVILEGGCFALQYQEIFENYIIFSPITLLTYILYLVIRFKSVGDIPQTKLKLPQQPQDNLVNDENQEHQQPKREILEAQQDDESKLRISLDQFKDAPDSNQNETIREYNVENPRKHEQEQHNNDTKLVLSGREGQFEILSSPSEQVKMATPNKQTCASCNYATQPGISADKRFCLQCLNEQPIRAKHCYFCQKCIPLYDHHCPWIGVCIGEKNKMLYLIYLYVQIGQIAVGIYIGLDPLNIPIVIILIIFALLLLSLSTYQCFYILRNITTWEFMSCNRISYLKGNHTKYLFDKGIINNLRVFLKYSCSSKLYDWQLE